MTRACLVALLTAVLAFAAPAAADARTPCAGEQAVPTVLNAGQVSGAIFCLSNQIRAHYGLPALRRDARLDSAAALHSLDMATRGFFAHVNPDGLDPTARAAAQGYPLGAGENIAYGYANARAVVLGWMASAGHCRNLLSGAADLGVGTAVLGTAHYTQVLGDYFTRPVDEAPRSGCPYTIDLDTLSPAPSLVAQPAATQPSPDAGPVTASRPAQATRAATPSLRKLVLAPRRFRAGGRGTTVSYTLSAPATVTFRVQRRSAGTYRTTSRRITQSGAAGANMLRFRVRRGDRALAPGRYRLLAVATDAAGRSTRVARATFVIVRR